MPSWLIVSNLAKFVNFTSKVLDEKGQVDVVYTDMSKVFDKVNGTLLLRKLHSLGFSAGTLKLFSSYLTGRKQYVSFLGYKSDPFFVQSGVPQGSNLGPLLFIIFVNDLISLLKCIGLMYADDLKIFYEIKTVLDCLALQLDLNVIYEWCVRNKLQLNINKCCVMSFHRKTNPI